MIQRHTDREFAAELEGLRQRMLLMAGRVEEMIGLSVRALTTGDTHLANETILRDRRVNQDELDVDDQCLRLLARWQPMAGDLRFIVFSQKTVTDLERIGDLAANICERAVELHGHQYSGSYYAIPEMAERTQKMVDAVIDAFVRADEQAARTILESDAAVDRLYLEMFRELMSDMSNGAAAIETAIPLLNVAKYLERVGDHATNVAEKIIFMIRGTDVRHDGKLPGT